MNTTAQRHSEADRPLTDLISTLPDDAWRASSPCEGWTGRDLLAHLIDTQREFLEGRGFEVGDRPDLADPAVAWRAHTARVAQLLADDGIVGTAYDSYFGPTTIGATFEQFYLFDMVVHRWDLARTAGLDHGFTETELDRIEAGVDSFGDALYMDGVCAPGVTAPDGADRATRLLARMGRIA